MRRNQAESDILQVLDWYAAMGVDCAVSEDAADWFATQDETTRLPAAERSGTASALESILASAPPAAGQPAPARSAPLEAESDARALAAKAESLEELRACLASFDGCALKATAKSLCFYRGAERARVAIIGEAPGREEDLAGKPFVGRAGKLLDKMLAAIGLSEADVHITNVVYWRPPGNRTPTPAEAQVCRPFLERQLELVEPDLVLVIGGAAAKTLLQVNDGIMRLRGKWRQIAIGGRTLRVMPTLHPAYLLRTPAAKRQAWRDLLAVQQTLSQS